MRSLLALPGWRVISLAHESGRRDMVLNKDGNIALEYCRHRSDGAPRIVHDILLCCCPLKV